MKKLLIKLSLLLVLSCVPACGDLTFVNEGKIDFDRYQSVTVLPITVEGIYQYNSFSSDTDSFNFLISELRSSSGFVAVVDNPSAAITDADLSVWISTREDYDYETDTVTYKVNTEFSLSARNGREILSGTSISSDTDLEDAVNETLTEVSYYFLRPYRI